jgi:hypothetical protein
MKKNKENNHKKKKKELVEWLWLWALRNPSTATTAKN